MTARTVQTVQTVLIMLSAIDGFGIPAATDIIDRTAADAAGSFDTDIIVSL